MTDKTDGMEAMPLDEVAGLVEGALGVRVGSDYVRPWRLPLEDVGLHDQMLRWMASMPAGIRLRFATDSPTVGLDVEHVILEGFDAPSARYDLVVGGSAMERATVSAPSARLTFGDLPDDAPIEIWLPHRVGVRIRSFEVEDGCTLSAVPDRRPRWVTYGSSITHCMEVPGPTETWPALAAGALDWHLTCLGFTGMCHLDPLMGRAMASLPVDRFTLKLGINVHNMASLRARTFAPLVHGLIATLRDSHPITPITVISPIFSPEREHSARSVMQTPNGEVVLDGDLTLVRMREILREVVELWQRRGDATIDYLDGRTLLGEADAAHLPDGLHPDTEGYALIAERFVRHFSLPGN